MLWARTLKIPARLPVAVLVMWTHRLFRFCHLLQLAVTTTQCWMKGDSVKRTPVWEQQGLGNVFMKPRYIQGELSFPQFTPFQGMWTHHTSQVAMQKENNPPPPLLLGSLPWPPCSVPRWTSWSCLNVELARWHFANYHTILLQFILVLIIHHSSMAYWNKHRNICQIFSQILFCTLLCPFLMQEAFVSLNPPASSCFSYQLIDDLTILGPLDLCFLYVTTPVSLPG